MKIVPVILALWLAFLLFTPQGRFIGEAAWLKAVTPAPDTAKIAAERACAEAFYAKASAHKPAKNAIPGFDPNADNHYKAAPPPPC
jgi:hypothetical protein